VVDQKCIHVYSCEYELETYHSVLDGNTGCGFGKGIPEDGSQARGDHETGTQLLSQTEGGQIMHIINYVWDFVWFCGTVIGLYWIIRLAVAAGIEDARR